MQIVIDEGGSCEFTRSPALLGLLHPDDRKRIDRMTDIGFGPEYQRFYIEFLKGPYKGRLLTILLQLYDTFSTEYGGFEDDFQIHTRSGGLLTWATYEEAVRAEIRFVEFLRDLGYSMDG